MDDDKRAPGTDAERAKRLEKMMASQVNHQPPEQVGLSTGYKVSSSGFGVTAVDGSASGTSAAPPGFSFSASDIGKSLGKSSFSSNWGSPPPGGAAAADASPSKFSFSGPSAAPAATVTPADGAVFNFGSPSAGPAVSSGTFKFGQKPTEPEPEPEPESGSACEQRQHPTAAEVQEHLAMHSARCKKSMVDVKVAPPDEVAGHLDIHVQKVLSAQPLEEY